MQHPHQAYSTSGPLSLPAGWVLGGRRSLLQAGLTGFCGLNVPSLLTPAATANERRSAFGTGKSVILLWMTGGPSQIDTWDPKPDRPDNNRGPFSPIESRVPGIRICEHLPRQAAMMDQFTLIRSVDARGSSHGPNSVMQTGRRDADPNLNRRGDRYPAIGSIVSKFHGPNANGMPAYAAFFTGRGHIAGGGDVGKQHDPFDCGAAAKLPIYDNVGVDTGRRNNADLFSPVQDLTASRLHERRSLLQSFDLLRSDLDQSNSMASLDHFGQMAVDMVLGEQARRAFDLELEAPHVRDRYGRHLWCQQALLARRLVEAGVAFVTIDLSYHTASGTWDTHGDLFPPYGGIESGLKPLLPLFDHLLTTLVTDLEARGMLDDVLVIAMGEFGRTPTMGTQGSPDGRNHWTDVMSVCLAGGGLRHGQVIGSSDETGGYVQDRPVLPADLAATMYHHFQLPPTTTYIDHTQRPRFIVEHGEAIKELI